MSSLLPSSSADFEKMPESSRLCAAIIRQAESTPAMTALTDGYRNVSYRELIDRAFVVAGWIVQRKVERFGLYRENSVEWVIIDIAALISGATLVPLPTFFSDQQLAHIIELSNIDTLLCDDIDRLRRIVPGVRLADNDIEKTHSVALNVGLEKSNIESMRSIAKITFTSGTTGTPKGVCLGNQEIDQTAFSLADLLGYQSSTRHLSILPFSTLLENVAGVYVPLMLGKTVVVLPSSLLGIDGSSNLDIYRFIEAINTCQPDSLILLPQLLLAIVSAEELGLSIKKKPGFIALGGAKTAPSLIEKARAMGLPVFEGYGLSECGSVVSLNTPDACKVGSVGRPLAHVSVEIREGEVWVKGNRFIGYLEEPVQNDDWLNTGDLGFIDKQGFLHISGRRKNVMVSTYGRNISPEWIESEICKSPSFMQCIVFGDNRPFCSAVLVPRNKSVSSGEVSATIEQINLSLPDYAQIDRWVVAEEPFTFENGMLTDNGRPRRKEISIHYQKQVDALYL